MLAPDANPLPQLSPAYLDTRAKVLSRLHPSVSAEQLEDPRALFARSEERAFEALGTNVSRLIARCRGERARGVSHNWTYDLAAHMMLREVLRVEQAAYTILLDRRRHARLMASLDATARLLDRTPAPSESTPESAPSPTDMLSRMMVWATSLLTQLEDATLIRLTAAHLNSIYAGLGIPKLCAHEIGRLVSDGADRAAARGRPSRGSPV
jgi:hypothetical protein